MSKNNTPHGYSGKQLYQKLGLNPGLTCLPINPPEHYDTLVAGAVDVLFRQRAQHADIVHLFCKNRKALTAKLQLALGKLGDTGVLWVSWPKKSSALFVDLTENQLREIILPTGWVDVKVCAVDADWSGLKFVLRKELRK